VRESDLLLGQWLALYPGAYRVKVCCGLWSSYYRISILRSTVFPNSSLEFFLEMPTPAFYGKDSEYNKRRHGLHGHVLQNPL
jgi:hypothetical protein